MFTCDCFGRMGFKKAHDSSLVYMWKGDPAATIFVGRRPKPPKPLYLKNGNRKVSGFFLCFRKAGAAFWCLIHASCSESLKKNMFEQMLQRVVNYLGTGL